uniref:Putative regulator of ribonuclease activity n=1 Tax=Zeugodacus cucurbitae TaxID=28588 RepID=A0A0A1XJ16_ZEUCU
MFLQRLRLTLGVLQLPLALSLLLICHGVCANSAANESATATSTTAAPLVAPLVSSSEATLLTTQRLFPTTTATSTSATLARQARARQRYDDEVADVESVQPNAAATNAKASAPPKLGRNVGNLPKKRYKVLSVHTNCTRDLFTMRIDLNRDFRGLVYAKDFPLECSARGNAQQNVTLRLPTSGCGVRAEPRADGVMELSVRVMLQMEQKLRQSSDILRTVRCKLPPTAMGMMVGPIASMANKRARIKAGQQWKVPANYRNGRMRTLGAPQKHNNHATATTATPGNEDFADAPQAEASNIETQTLKEEQQGVDVEKEQEITTTSKSAATTAKPANNSDDVREGGGGADVGASTTTSNSNATPRVRIWLELGGLDGIGAVEVGQATTLTVRAIVPGNMGVRVVDCAALDGLGESKQQLLDERGCTIDEQVMPPLNKHFKPLDEGWSKQQPDDLMEKTFTATFPAFKFPDRERLHVSCGVQLCKGNCPNVNCRSSEPLQLSADKHLARIEVFNSLAVTAPQIEVDRLRYDRRYNMSAEEYPPHIRHIHSDGTLCLSVSKLAISFCVLGLIFLLAVIVAIYSLIRARRRTTGSSCALTPPSSGTGHMQRAELCTSMFSSSSESAQSARFGSKLLMPYYPNTLPYGRVY